MNRIATVLLLSLLLIGCSRATPDNFSRLESGMSPDEVHALLGEPDEVSGAGAGRMTLMTERWIGREHVISVTFAFEQLSLKSIEPRQMD